MASMQKTFNWLGEILQRDYHDPQRAYEALSFFLTTQSEFTPRTDVYTYENGSSALLLQLAGAIPVDFRGKKYHYPVIIWIPHTFPHEEPIVFVRPGDDMIVRSSQYVSGQDGRIYHPYLAGWRQQWQRSSISQLLALLADIFMREPPILSREQPKVPGHALPVAGAPPQLPSKPFMHTGSGPGPLQRASTIISTPPPLPPPPPPKMNIESSGTRAALVGQHMASRGGRYESAPPLPTEIPRPMATPTSLAYQSIHQSQYPGTVSSNSYLYGSPQPHSQQSQPVLGGRRHQRPHATTTTQNSADRRPPVPQIPYQQSPQAQHAYTTYPASQPDHTPKNRSVPQLYQSTSQAYADPQKSFPHHPKPKLIPQPDLLDSPSDAIFSAPSQSLPTPTIPPNPEKAQLLATLSQTLLSTLHQELSQSTSAFPPLQSQHTALIAAQGTLQSELSALRILQGQLQSNISDLTSTLQRADQIVTQARKNAQDKKGLSSIDESIIPPTVLARQLYETVAEQRGHEAATQALNEALMFGRIGVDIWGRQCRNVSREEFRRRWMVRRIANGMGLDLGELGNGALGAKGQVVY